MPILVATDREVVVIDAERGTSASAQRTVNRPTCLAGDPMVPGRGWCGAHRGGAARKLDQSAARKVIHRKDVHSTLFARSGLFLVRSQGV